MSILVAEAPKPKLWSKCAERSREGSLNCLVFKEQVPLKCGIFTMSAHFF